MDPYTWTCQFLLIRKNVFSSALCGHWMEFRRPAGSDGWSGLREKESQKRSMLAARLDYIGSLATPAIGTTFSTLRQDPRICHVFRFLLFSLSKLLIQHQPLDEKFFFSCLLPIGFVFWHGLCNPGVSQIPEGFKHFVILPLLWFVPMTQASIVTFVSGLIYCESPFPAMPAHSIYSSFLFRLSHFIAYVSYSFGYY